MSETLYWVLVFIGGIALGLFFFGGLWFTINKAVNAKIPALWFFVSFVIRIGAVMLGFYYVSSVGWQGLITCLIGFITARFIVTHFTKPMAKKEEVYIES
jgi:F1F0 ATPase subunit 2